MRVFIIVAAFMLAQAYGNAIRDDQCDGMHLKQCADKFEKALGLDPMTRDVNVIDQQIKKLEAEGKKNQVCNAAKVLETCLGTEYNACISVKYLESVGVPEADAKKFVAINQQMRQQCSQIDFAARNDQCDGMHYSKCADLFAGDLHLGLHMPKLQVVNKQIKDLEAKGKHEHLQLCNARLFLETCLGPDYKGCVSVEYYKSIGEPETDAKEFITLMQDLKKQCTQVNFASTNPTRDQPLFTKCTDSFAQALGLPSMPKNATVLFFQIVKITFSNPQGETRVCNAGKNLHSCLGQGYNACVSVDFIESMGIPEKDAKEFVEISQTLEKECAT